MQMQDDIDHFWFFLPGFFSDLIFHFTVNARVYELGLNIKTISQIFV